MSTISGPCRAGLNRGLNPPGADIGCVRVVKPRSVNWSVMMSRDRSHRVRRLAGVGSGLVVDLPVRWAEHQHHVANWTSSALGTGKCRLTKTSHLSYLEGDARWCSF